MKKIRYVALAYRSDNFGSAVGSKIAKKPNGVAGLRRRECMHLARIYRISFGFVVVHGPIF